MMLVIVTGSLRIGADSWDAGEERMARASRLFVVANFLRSHIGSLLPVAGTVKNGQMEPAFRGGPDSVSYVAAMPEQVRAGGLYRFELYVAKNGESRDLRVAILPYSQGPDRGESQQPIDDLALVENIRDFRISYLPRRNLNLGFDLTQVDAKPPEWTEEWKQPQLPGVVRVEITPKGEEPWPALMIVPKTLMLR
jgi:general secretion pathway protein J